MNFDSMFDEDLISPTQNGRPVAGPPAPESLTLEGTKGVGRDMTNEEKMGLALIALATPILGGMMGGKHGAMAGAVSGLKGAGTGVQAIADEDAELKKEARTERAYQRKRADSLTDSKELIQAKAEATPQKRNTTKNAAGQVIDVDTAEVIDETKTPPKVAKGPAAPKPVDPSKSEDSLRREHSKSDITKRTNAVEQAWAAMQGTKEDGPGDMRLLYGYIKLMDPTTGIKEGEYASAENTRGIPDHILAAYNKAKDGQKLSTEQRKSFLDEARTMVNAQRAIQKKYDDGIRGIASQRNAKPENVIINTFPAEPDAPVVPAVPAVTPEQAAAELARRRAAAAGGK